MSDQAQSNFWNRHSLEFLDMALKRDHQEVIHNCDGYGRSTRDCGDTVEIFLTGRRNILENISYHLKGCLFSHACVNALICLASGKSMEAARKISSEDIIHLLKTLPQQEEHCAFHALEAFRAALDDMAEGRPKTG